MDQELQQKLRQELINVMFSIRLDFSSKVRKRVSMCIKLAKLLNEKELVKELKKVKKYAVLDGRVIRNMDINYYVLAERWNLTLDYIGVK